jgi:hypothetical protein
MVKPSLIMMSRTCIPAVRAESVIVAAIRWPGSPFVIRAATSRSRGVSRSGSALGTVLMARAGCLSAAATERENAVRVPWCGRR